MDDFIVMNGQAEKRGSSEAKKRLEELHELAIQPRQRNHPVGAL